MKPKYIGVVDKCSWTAYKTKLYSFACQRLPGRKCIHRDSILIFNIRDTLQTTVYVVLVPVEHINDCFSDWINPAHKALLLQKIQMYRLMGDLTRDDISVIGNF